MRAWGIFGNSTAPANTALIRPPRSNLPIDGERSTVFTPVFGYPGELTFDEIEEWFYRIRVATFVHSYGLEGTNGGGDHYIVTGAFTGAVVSNLSPTNNERTLLSPFPYVFGAQTGFTITYSGSVTEDINGSSITTPVAGAIAAFSVAPAFTNGLTPIAPSYYYRTDTGLYIPAMEVNGGSSAGYVPFSSFVSLTPGAGQQEVEEPLTINGIATTVSILIPDFMGVTDFEMTITPDEWWPYKDDNGNNPVWNSATGERIILTPVPMFDPV